MSFNIDLKKIGETIEKLRKTESSGRFLGELKEFDEEQKRVYEIMSEIKWPSWEGLYVNEIRNIYKIDKESGGQAKEEIENYLLKLYDKKRLALILDEWERQKWLVKRMPIFRQAIDAHILGNYWISIPALLPHVEGMILDRYGHLKGTARFRQIRDKYLKELLQIPIESILATFIIEEGVLKKWTHGDELDFPLNRHAILHGGDFEYGKKAINSLKAILLIDALQRNLVRIVGTAKSKCYHIVGCSRIDITHGEPVYYEHYLDAEYKGKKPCKVCKPNPL